MSPQFDVIAQLAETAAGGADPRRADMPISRTSWKHYLVDYVLPVGTLASMAVVTVVVIVLVVTTVAETGLDLGPGRNDAWSRWACTPVCSIWNHRSAYASLAPLTDTTQVNRNAPSRSAPDEINSRRVALRLGDE